MGNIEKIRKFVKELQQDFISIQPKDCSLDLIKSYAGYAYLDKVLSFLDTLSEEPGKSLKEAAEDAVCMAFGGDPAYYGNKAEFSVNECIRLFTAGAEWGAEHFRDTTKMIDKSLEEAAKEYEWSNVDTNQLNPPTLDMTVQVGDLRNAFKAGAEWGAEHFRDTTKMIGKSLEEIANEFANQDCVTFISRKKGFIAGAEWQKEQMLKDAIPFYEILKAVPSFERENTRIIIVNEEE
jgi:hypothetical protein